MTVRGWCPTVHEPMTTGDGLLVRVKPRGGILDAASVRLIAREALAQGNGTIELTSRGNFQVRGLSPESARRLAGAMVNAGLASSDVDAERRRNVLATPLAGLDPGVHPATAEITAELETALELAPDLGGLPAKFGFLVEGGGLLPPRAALDVRIRLRPEGAEVARGDEVRQVPLDQVVRTALELAGRESTARTPRSPLALPPGLPGQGAVGAIGEIAFGVGLPFGCASADAWAGLAAFAEREGDGCLRLTAWRAVLIGGVVSGRGLDELGLITAPEDPRLRVSACPGQPGCGSASVATREIAALLRPRAGTTVHVSGCSKGCAHQAAATLTLVGRDGRFDLIRQGRAGDTPSRRGLSAAEVLAL